MSLIATGKISAPHAIRLARSRYADLDASSKRSVHALVMQYEQDKKYKASIKPKGKVNHKDYSDMEENLTEYGDGPRPGLSPDEAWKENRRRQKTDGR